MSEHVDLWRKLTTKMHKPNPAAHIDLTIAALKVQIDNVIEMYKDLGDKVMEASMKGSPPRLTAAALKIKKSQVKTKEPRKTYYGSASEMKWMKEDLIFNPGSKFANIDIHYYFSKPEAWNALTEDQKAEIRGLLPESTLYNDDGSPHESFLKRDLNWRYATRRLQEEIASGMLDPKWQADAAKAMEERAFGEFDAFKENQYEEFWGQKQKVPSDALAGKSATLTLCDLVLGGAFKVGDVWSYVRCFGSNLVEKDCTIGQIHGDKLVFLVPPGDHKFMPARFTMDIKAAETANFMEKDKTAKDTSGVTLIESPTLGHHKFRHEGTFYDDGTASSDGGSSTVPSTPVGDHKSDKELLINTCKIFAVPDPAEVLGNPAIVLIDRPIQLERKILELGSSQIKGPKSNKAWKYFRCLRDNQDIGSLFDLREKYYNKCSKVSC